MAFNEITPEQRAEALDKARLARSEQAAFNKANEHKYKLEYADSNHWAELATKYKCVCLFITFHARRKG